MSEVNAVVMIVQLFFDLIRDRLKRRDQRTDQRSEARKQFGTACANFVRYLGCDQEMASAVAALRETHKEKRRVRELCDEMLDTLREGPSENWKRLRDQIRQAIDK